VVPNRVIDGVRHTWRRLTGRYGWLDVAGRVQQRFGEVHGGFLAGAVTLSAFLSLFPLILVAVAVLGFVAGERPDLTHQVLDALALPPRGEAADAIRHTIDRAEESKAAASIIGIVGLLWSGLGLVSALQHTYDTVWQVKDRGIKDKAFGMAWLAGSGLLFAASFAVTAAVGWLPAWLAPLNLLVGLALNAAMFLWAMKVLPNRDVGWRPLVPGAILGAIGFEVLKVVGGIYVPRAVASSSAVYGSLGVVFAIIAWLFFFGRLIVYSSTLNVVLWERVHGTETIDVEVPLIPGRDAEEGTRAGKTEAAGV
jgi:membrane protein